MTRADSSRGAGLVNAISVRRARAGPGHSSRARGPWITGGSDGFILFLAEQPKKQASPTLHV